MKEIDDLVAHSSYVRSCLRRFGARHPDVDDLIQDVFHRLLDHRDSFDDTRPIRPWLTGLAFRVWSESERRRKRSRAEAETWALPPNSPEEILTQSELALAVETATAKISSGRRSIFELHEIEGISVPELAKRGNIPLNTAYSQIRLAREEFRKAMLAADVFDASSGDRARRKLVPRTD